MKHAIVVLGGWLWKDGKVWRTVDLGQGRDKGGFINDRWRVIAAYYLWQKRPQSIVVASGGKGQLANMPEAPTVASVIKKELVELGVPNSMILEEDNSGNTYEQLKILPAFTKSNGIQALTIISNEWHLPRIETMFEYAPDLKGVFDSLKVNLVSAESVLLKADPKKWQTKIFKARSNPEMKKRFAREEQGIEEIKSGTYKYNR